MSACLDCGGAECICALKRKAREAYQEGWMAAADHLDHRAYCLECNDARNDYSTALAFRRAAIVLRADSTSGHVARGAALIDATMPEHDKPRSTEPGGEV